MRVKMTRRQHSTQQRVVAQSLSREARTGAKTGQLVTRMVVFQDLALRRQRRKEMSTCHHLNQQQLIVMSYDDE